MEFFFIKDTQTGKTLQVLRLPLDKDYIVTEGDKDPIVVKKVSIGKVVRNWMKDRRKTSK